jgi:small nuclear ribonucleoprotein (snRNP)-like protein
MRKLTAIMLAGALTLSALAPTALADNNAQRNQQRPQYEQDFKDWQSDYWANESLARMITRGVIQGNGDATIASFRSVTRLEAAIMMSRLLELQAPEIPTGHSTVKASWGEIQVTNTTSEFTIRIKTAQGEFTLADGADIPEWGRKAILVGLREGFLVFDGASLSPMKALSRLEAAIMMVKAAGLDAQAQARAGASLDFKDADKIPARLRGYVAIAVESGFVTGYEDGTFQPAQVLTRAEWAALLDRLDRQNGAPVTADGRQIKATVTAVANSAVTVTTPVYPGGVTYRVAANAVIYSGGKEIALAEIHADDQVIINLNNNRQVLLLTVTNVKRQVSGKVASFVSPSASVTGSIRLSGTGTSRTYTVNNQTKVLLGGQTATFADLRTGDQVTLKLDGSVVKEIAITAETGTVVGTLQAVSFGSNTVLPSVTVRSSNQAQVSYRIADYAVIKAANGTAITLGDLNMGDELTLKTERDLVVAIQVKASAPARTVTGALVAVDPGTNLRLPTIELMGTNNGSTTYTIADHATVKAENGAAITLRDLHVGDQLTLKVERNLVTAIQVKVGMVKSVSGKVGAFVTPTASVAGAVAVRTDNTSATYTVTGSTEVRLDGKKVTFADIRVGDQVTLTLDGSRVTQIAITAEKFTIMGKLQIVAMGGGSIQATVTIKGANGVTMSYMLAGRATIKAANGATIRLQDLHAGDSLSLTVERNLVTAIRVQ